MMQREETMYKTSGKVTEETLQNINSFYLRKWNTFSNIMTTLIGIWGIILIIQTKYVLGVFVLAMTIISLLADRRTRKKTTKKLKNVIIEKGDGAEIRCSAEFGMDGIRFTNETRDLTVEFAYSTIFDGVCFEDMLLLRTKGKQAIYAFPKQLAEEKKESLLAMLSRRGIRITKSKKSVL